MDTERYCEETQPHDADCEDNFAKTGITVLLVYQATQMLTAWAAWSLLVGVRDPASVAPVQVGMAPQVPQQPTQAYAVPVDAPASSAGDVHGFGHEMAERAGKDSRSGKHKKRSGGGSKQPSKRKGKHTDEYEPASWDTPKKGHKSKVRLNHCVGFAACLLPVIGLDGIVIPG